MRNIAFIIFVLSLFNVFAGEIRAADVFPLKVERLAPNVVQVSNVANVGYVTLGAYFTPDGKYLIVWASGEFCVVPVAKLDEGIENLDKTRAVKGYPSAYLPSGKIVFSTVQGLYALDPGSEKIQTIYTVPASEVDEESYYLTGNLAVLSDDLIISGDGDFTGGGAKGNILRFDVRRRSRARGATVPAFYRPQLSPGGNYLLFEYGSEVGFNNGEIYDVARGVSYPLASRFDFKRAFPQFKRTNERPVGWVAPDLILSQVERRPWGKIMPGDSAPEPPWLVLLNAKTARIVWKKRLAEKFGAATYEQLSEAKMLVDTGRWELYELSLANGALKELSQFKGLKFALAPDRQKLAYYADLNQVFTSDLEGSDKRKLLDLPKDFVTDRWSVRTPLWSPDGKRLFVFNDKQFLYMRL